MKLSFNRHFLTVSYPDIIIIIIIIIIIRRIMKHKNNKFNTQRHIKYQKWIKVVISAFWVINITLPIATIITINSLRVLQANFHKQSHPSS